MKKIMEKMKAVFSSHFRLQRFGIMFVIGCLGLGVSTIGGYAEKSVRDQNQLSSQTVYTSEFMSSLTGTGGQVVGLFSNESRDELFLLFRMNSMKDMAIDASNYMMILQAKDVKQNYGPVQNRGLLSALYVYGNTGYFGVYMIRNGGFVSQLTDIIFRNNKSMTSSTVSKIRERDQSYSMFDQWKMVINPGASGTIHLAGMDAQKDFSTNESLVDIASGLYREIMIQPARREEFDKLKGYLKKMADSRLKIDEYESRCAAAGLIVPDLPAEMSDDQIVFDDQDQTEYLQTSYVFPDGINLRWNTPDNLLESTMLEMNWTGTRDEFVQKLSANGMVEAPEREYLMSDGTDLDSLSASKRSEINEYIRLLESEVLNYLTLKHDYQAEQKQLLILDARGMDAVESITVKTEDVLFYGDN